MADDAPIQGGMRGRPRRDGSRRANQRAEIIAAALELFSRNGYAGTSMSSIARAVGLDQSSLYYWFSRKEDILRDAVESNRSSLQLARRIGEEPGQKAAQLYAVLYADALMLGGLAFDYYVLEQAALDQPERFSELFDDYRDLIEWVARIIDDGVAEGCFRPCDAVLEAVFALASHEGLQHRVHRTAFPGLAAHADAAAAVTPERAAHVAASGTVARLLARGTVDAARATALERGWL